MSESRQMLPEIEEDQDVGTYQYKDFPRGQNKWNYDQIQRHDPEAGQWIVVVIGILLFKQRITEALVNVSWD